MNASENERKHNHVVLIECFFAVWKVAKLRLRTLLTIDRPFCGFS
jgi:hypothetical protein